MKIDHKLLERHYVNFKIFTKKLGIWFTTPDKVNKHLKEEYNRGFYDACKVYERDMTYSEECCNIFSNNPTPTLTGEAAIYFLDQLEKNKNNKVDPEEVKRIREMTEKILKNAKL